MGGGGGAGAGASGGAAKCKGRRQFDCSTKNNHHHGAHGCLHGRTPQTQRATTQSTRRQRAPRHAPRHPPFFVRTFSSSLPHPSEGCLQFPHLPPSLSYPPHPLHHVHRREALDVSEGGHAVHEPCGDLIRCARAGGSGAVCVPRGTVRQLRPSRREQALRCCCETE